MTEVLAQLALFENATRAMSSSFQRLLESDLPASVKQEFVKNSKVSGLVRPVTGCVTQETPLPAAVLLNSSVQAKALGCTSDYPACGTCD